MGSKLAVLARLTVAIALVTPTLAVASPAVDELMQQGSEAYKAGKYDVAITAFDKAYALDPKPDTLFALAQVERLGGYCDKAIVHYKQVLASLTDLDKSKLVQSNLALCERQAPPPVEPPVEPPAPSVVTPPPDPALPPPASVVHVERRGDKLAIVAATAGALGLGAGLGLHLAANSSRDDAASARTLDDNRTLNSRADTQRLLSITSFAAGGALVGFAIYRWVRRDEPPPQTTVSITPTPHAPTISLITRW